MAELNDPHGPAAQGGVREFEFDGAQNAVIERLSATMRFVGVVSLIGAVLYGLSAVIHLVLCLVQPVTSNLAMLLVTGSISALFYCTGTWTTHAAGSFKYIATTTGNDISNLMSALGELLKLYRLQKVIIIVSLSIAAIGMLLMIGSIGSVAPRA